MELPSAKSSAPVAGLSIDGGKVRLPTPQLGVCEWRDYKVVSLHDSVCNAYFQDHAALIAQVQQNPRPSMVTCVGDGHDGIWNIIAQIAFEHQRREVLDWFHLVENLYKVDGSLSCLKKLKASLWSGLRSGRS